MPDLTIVNTSPLFYLHQIELLEILHKLYGTITIPEAVKKELEEGHNQGEEVPQLAEYTPTLQKCLYKTSVVIPAKAGIQGYPNRLDSP
jgi:predicted nucleic acid-binding protein